MANFVGFHGEVMLKRIASIPTGTGLKKVEANKDGYVIVAESEMTGNHHQVLVEGKKVEFFENNGTLYMKALEDTEICCVVKERHDNCTIPAGTWEFTKQLEYDPIDEVLREARD